ncbi:hypothetical protein N7532_008357 [Penicillium argentinense]|uniref:Methyltransferase type 11 domain-containing protein n=1 Tax=Penicillium argentinense TaxID=1131581 RepID=A0A9W9EX65_9EURO|nr:uncharacterized protein N7532_008357 [Penicillium argentinense]KAJ5089673.1 hypothetical protein N7532_008357 [Penicillium argentinense]
MDTPKPHGPVELASLRTTVDIQTLPPVTTATPLIPSASTPSTRYSESPGVWSRGSTPTSLSSYSPGIVHPTKIGRLRQPCPSQTRLSVFSPPATTASPQTASVEHAESNSRKTPPHRPTGLPKGKSTTTTIQRQPSTKSIASLNGPPHSPPQRRSSVNFSPPKRADIDVEKARKEVEEAERELFNAHRPKEIASGAEVSVPKTPPRPSREGTHRLDLEASPVIKSNLPYLRSTGHTRRESAEKIRLQGQQNTTPLPSQPAAASTDPLPSKDLSRIPSREAGPPVMARKALRTLTKEPPAEMTDPRKTTSSSKRFGLFSKKSKPAMEESAAEQTRSTRKGPTAGTGHEGYGKYSHRGRKASASSSTGTRTRSSSTTRSASRSVASSKGSMSSRPDLELDDFFSSRLEPVIITGGGREGSTLSRTESEQSISSMSVASSNLPRPTPLTSSTAQSTESLATSTSTSGETYTPTKKGASEPTDSKSPEKRLLATASTHGQPQKSRMPVPTGRKQVVYANLDAAVSRTSLSSQGTSSTIPQKSNGIPNQSIQVKEPPKPEETQVKKSKSSRWNPFQKNRGNEPKGPAPTAPALPSHAAQLHAAISPVASSRQVAHYAFVDEDSDELDRIISNIQDSPPTEEEVAAAPVPVPAGLNIQKRQPSILLPSPPKMHGEFDNEHPSPKTALFNRNIMGPEPENSPEDRRPRRLASVGRIPKVVSRRDREHKPVLQSFSRPFSVAESPSLPAPTLENVSRSPDFNGSPSTSRGYIPTSVPFEWNHRFNPAFSAPEQISALDFLAGPYSADDFLHFSPPHKDSVSSSSSGALAAVTAVVPKHNAAPTEDEVWNEYDDLIDHLSPEEPKPDQSSNPTTEDGRFQNATMASRALQDGLNNSPRSLQPPPLPTGHDSNRDSGDSVRLRRSRIVSALHSSIAPSTQPSYSDLIASYGDEEHPSSPVNTSQDFSDQVQQQQSTFLHSLAAVPPSKPKSDGRKPIPGSSERDWDAVTRTNMRSASLMTSRWLSFGRVLFSPAHNHVKSGTHGRILVIDGLGNDDWSFYCSLTYPDAEVYSLSGRPVSTAMPHPAAWQPPTNHHTVYHAGLQNPLPFPKDYFAVAVLRFPAATSEAVQNNIVQECRRVLRSGGYLEMSLLDRDMVNMGIRTRKAVRRLKEMTCMANSTINLSPTSDSIQRLIGTQGFDNLRRCMVRIPVAGMVVRSSDSTTSSSNRSFSASATTQSTGFSLPSISASTTTGSRTASKSSPSEDNISLGDLLSDPSPSAANDESIAKIVARVGRWWYTKCYEDPVLPDTGDNGPSMWNDRKTLRECQKLGTGFRMLIAYTQKPSEVKRRTASV